MAMTPEAKKKLASLAMPRRKSADDLDLDKEFPGGPGSDDYDASDMPDDQSDDNMGPLDKSLPEDMTGEKGSQGKDPLADVSDVELLAEIKKRGLQEGSDKEEAEESPEEAKDEGDDSDDDDSNYDDSNDGRTLRA